MNYPYLHLRCKNIYNVWYICKDMSNPYYPMNENCKYLKCISITTKFLNEAWSHMNYPADMMLLKTTQTEMSTLHA